MNLLKTCVLLFAILFCTGLIAQSSEVLKVRESVIQKFVNEMGMKLYYHSKKDADQYKKFEADGTYWIAFISEEDGFCWSLRLEEKNTSPPYPKIENVVGFYKVGGAYHAHYKFRFGHTGKFKPLPWLSSDKSVYTEFLIFEE